MSSLSDSGFEEDLQSPSPSKQRLFVWSAEAGVGLTADYDESCFIVQRNNELHFITLNCLARQPQVTAEARCRLVSWLIAVHKHLTLSFESCCLAVNIMDRFLATTAVAADCFQLLGVTSLLIATKHVEVCSPRIQQLLSLCCNSFSRDQLCNLECLVLLRLNFRLAAPTLAFFLDYLIGRELHHSPRASEEQLSQLKWYRCFTHRVCELTLADYTFNKYQPSVIALSAVGLAKELLQGQIKASPVQPGNSTDLFTRGHQSPGLENTALIQQCTEELKLLVSLNQESLQDLMVL